MQALSDLLNERLIFQLKKACSRSQFPGIDFKTAMEFFLSDGLIPASNLPVSSFLALEDWIRQQTEPEEFTTTDLKNKTGTLLNLVMRGKTIRLVKHGKPIAELRPYPPR